jgi:hypothetical protein
MDKYVYNVVGVEMVITGSRGGVTGIIAKPRAELTNRGRGPEMNEPLSMVAFA